MTSQPISLHEFLALVSPHTLTSRERIVALYDSLSFVVNNKVLGDVVECGVWKGGNVLGMCKFLQSVGEDDRGVWLFDTFTGMTTPGEHDVDLHNSKEYPMCNAEIELVKQVVNSSNYPTSRIRYVVGDVNHTLNDESNLPDTISILRLDTDWYESTKKELAVLWSRLSINGILIVDDYGHWQGAKKAFHEFFDEIGYVPKIEKIDYTGIRVVKSVS